MKNCSSRYLLKVQPGRGDCDYSVVSTLEDETGELMEQSLRQEPDLSHNP